MIPFSCDISSDAKETNEQESMVNFINNFLNEMESIPDPNKADKYYFVRDLFKEIKWCLDESSDKEYNNLLFRDRGTYLKEEKEMYHDMKTKGVAIKYYNRHKKLNTKNAYEIKCNG